MTISITRMAIGAGMAVATSMGLGVGAASAAPLSGSDTAGHVMPTSEKILLKWYDTKKACNTAGKDGVRSHQWYSDEWVCEQGG
ncbi:hypothetical protein, partial [Actinoplanes siamensis]